MKTSKVEVVTNIADARSTVLSAQAAGETVGLVPTMGALHEGHLRLVDASLAECDRTVVSIFVNPTQFGPGEDEDRYPRTLDRDCSLLAERGCPMVFAPSASAIYRPGHETYVEVGSLAESLEGTIRPGHFRGVATVVLKLFNIIPANRAYFGRKDYQQVLVVQQMVKDFDLAIAVIDCPTVRELDGLAMSSRNAYLTPIERQQAAGLYKSLQLAESLYQAGECDVATLTGHMRLSLAEADITKVDYIAFVAAGTVTPVKKITGPTVVALAARLGTTRLIDNLTIG
ncbi:pantoate--beta-alanine ligase [Bythopirellula polymerisocia]|uniref:Pantothenate synthetase n=1 Tax=Bythopirellula polymerisocia TaxID=2528003 RepID=A0A5C6D088_9BACT|nr:pantoate--beta-alanine ligase [Bythopirellula polymerisocia]TWU30118.1 Pantoate-beta-alanine ligase [Bythopirellula polymerisocia]